MTLDNKIRLAAIDIGSNAIRMVLAEHDENGLKLLKKFRFPIRLGADVFDSGEISKKNLKESARTFQTFAQLAKKFRVTRVRAVGTSALREAKNRMAFIKLMQSKSDIQIELIDGVEEARLIHTAVKAEVLLDQQNALLIDVGGGSVELTFSDHGSMTATQSFPFGTVRTLQLLKKKKLSESDMALVIGEYLNPLTQFIHSHSPQNDLSCAIGTGGNIEALGKLQPKLLKSNNQSLIYLNDLNLMVQKLTALTYKERIEKLDMRPDRADVIIPASLIVQTCMRQAQIKKLIVPHVGLKEGVLLSLANDDLRSKSLKRHG